MKIGLVLGKFEVFHKGHSSLINFAKNNCDILNILICSNDEEEKIKGEIRLDWISQYYKNDNKIKILYTDIKLPYTSESDREISKIWSEYLMKLLPDVNVIFTSETYGDYLSEYMNIEHIKYDQNRNIIPISSTMIIDQPFKYWDYINDVCKHHFIKKICICGTESTGKSTLTEYLSKYFNTNYVQEWGRLIVSKSDNVSIDNIKEIAFKHAEDILNKIQYSNKILLSDTDLNTTKMYSKFFFDEIPIFEDWIEKANKFDLYIFLENDSPYIQDGTRLSKSDRDKLRDYHFNYLNSINVNLIVVNGENWDDRKQKVVNIIEKKFFNFN